MMTSASVQALQDYFREFDRQAVLKLSDYSKLHELAGRVFEKINELEKSRDSWREKYEELKKQQS